MTANTVPRLSGPDPAQPERFAAIVDRATALDGQPPFSDQSLIDLATGARRLIAVELDGITSGVALVTVGDGPREAEFVVDPDARHHGLGGRLLERLLGEAHGELLIWAHGDHPDARALAERHALVPVRELLQLRLAPVRATGSAAAVTAFRPGLDDAEWLALNALAFAGHPEQGRLTQRDLDARVAEDWFDPEDFLLAHDADGAMSGFCWLKIPTRTAVTSLRDAPEPAGVVPSVQGEFYAVGVSPAAQGSGLGRALVNAGLSRLQSRGIREASLYVEGDNTAAVSLYRSVGFTDYSIDIQYAGHPA